MTDLPRKPRIDKRRGHISSDPFREVRGFYDSEIAPLFELLVDDSLNNPLRHSLRKYLIVAIFAALDYFFRNSVKNLVDNNGLSLGPLFAPESHAKLDGFVKESGVTKGSIVASTYRFVDILEIDFVFSNLLQINSFLDYIIKLNDINQTRYVLDGHPLPIEYEKLTKAYKLRNDIAHEIKNVKISNSMVIAVWDNFMNVMDISQTVLLSVSDSHDQYSLNSDYWKGKERAKRKAAYKLYSDIIMLKLLDKPQIIITNSDLSTTDGTDLMYKDKTIAGTLHWVIRNMLREKLIKKNGEITSLTLKGENRFRRTTKLVREKWKRELSDITCSWIAKRDCYKLE